MSNLLDTMGSIIVGGMILLGVAGLLLQVNASTQDTIMSEICQVSAVSLGNIIEDDLRKIGYRVDSSTKILLMDSTHLVFLADLDNNSVIDTVAYRFNETRKGILVGRSGNTQGESRWSVSASRAAFSYFDSAEHVTADPGKVRYIAFELVLLNNVIPTMTNPQSASVTISSGNSDGAGAFIRRYLRPVNLGL